MRGMPAPYHHYAEVRGGLCVQLFWLLDTRLGRAVMCRAVERPPKPACACSSLLQRWGSMAFGQYVGGLQRQADEALAAASLAERQEAAALVGAVCELEAAFWSMAYEGSSSTEQ